MTAPTRHLIGVECNPGELLDETNYHRVIELLKNLHGEDLINVIQMGIAMRADSTVTYPNPIEGQANEVNLTFQIPETATTSPDRVSPARVVEVTLVNRQAS